jgi:aspartyl protease/uncharacterized protein DUF4124
MRQVWCRSLVIAIVLALAIRSSAAAELYQWTDADGVDHYSTDLARVPEADRARMRIIDTPMAGADTGPAPSPGTLVFASGAPIVADVQLNGVPITLVVDTGAAHTVISPTSLSRAGFDVAAGRRVQIAGVTGVADTREVVVPRLDVAGAQVGPIVVFAHEVPGLRADGLLGRDVLDQFVVTIDAARGRAVLTR